MNRLKLFFPYIILIILSFLAIRPFFHPGFFPMHDDLQPSRIFVMYDALQSGQFPVRWVNYLGFGLGYPLFNFYAPLPYYIGAVSKFFIPDTIAAAKIMIVFGILIAPINMYILASKLSDKFNATVVAILYLYAPYHAVQIFVRGSIGELYAYSFLPLLFLALFYLLGNKETKKISILKWYEDEKKAIVLGSISLAAIFISHNILGMITFYLLLFFFIFLLICWFRKVYPARIIFLFTFMISLGIGLSAFFTIPAFLEKSYTRVDELSEGGSDFHQHFVYIDQLWDGPWGYAGSASGREDGMSFKIGKLHVIISMISFFSLLYLFFKKKLQKREAQFYVFIFLTLAISVYCMIEPSVFLWEHLPLFPFIQYPWRFLTFTVMSFSFISIIVLNLLQNHLRKIIGIIFILLIIWYNGKYFQPQVYLNVVEKDYVDKSLLQQKYSLVSYEYMPKDINPTLVNDDTGIKVNPDGNNKIVPITDNPTQKAYNVNAQTPFTATMNIAYFPAWRAKINSSAISSFETNGRVALYLPAGEYVLNVFYQSTPIEKISNTISIFSLFLLVYVSLFQGKSIVWRKKAQ